MFSSPAPVYSKLIGEIEVLVSTLQDSNQSNDYNVNYNFLIICLCLVDERAKLKAMRSLSERFDTVSSVDSLNSVADVVYNTLLNVLHSSSPQFILSSDIQELRLLTLKLIHQVPSVGEKMKPFWTTAVSTLFRLIAITQFMLFTLKMFVSIPDMIKEMFGPKNRQPVAHEPCDSFLQHHLDSFYRETVVYKKDPEKGEGFYMKYTVLGSDEAYLPEAILNTLESVPSGSVSIRREMLVVIRQLIHTRYRDKFAPYSDRVFNEAFALGDDHTAKDQLRAYWLPLLGDYVFNMRNVLDQSTIMNGIRLFSRYIFDCTLTSNCQIIAMRSLSVLSDVISQQKDRTAEHFVSGKILAPKHIRILRDYFRYGLICLDTFFMPSTRAPGSSITREEKELMELFCQCTIINLLSTVQRTSSSLVAVGMEYILDNLVKLGYGQDACVVEMKLLKLIFSAVTAYPQQNEMVLKSYMPRLISSCMDMARSAEDAYNQLFPLRLLLNQFSSRIQSILFQAFVPLVPRLLKVKELMVDLILGIPFPAFEKHLPIVVEAIIEALNNFSVNLGFSALRVLESIIDMPTTSVAIKAIRPVRVHLLRAIWKVLRECTDEKLATDLWRCLSKMGGLNRYLIVDPELIFEQCYTNVSQTLNDNALQVHSCVMCKNVLTILLGPHGINIDLFRNSYVIVEDKACNDKLELTAFAKAILKTMICKAIDQQICTRHFAYFWLVFVMMKKFSLCNFSADPADSEENGKEQDYMDGLIVVDAVLKILKENNSDLHEVALKTIETMYNLANSITGSVLKSSELQIFQYLFDRVISLSYERPYYTKLSCCNAMMTLIECNHMLWITDQMKTIIPCLIAMIIDNDEDVKSSIEFASTELDVSRTSILKPYSRYLSILLSPEYFTFPLKSTILDQIAFLDAFSYVHSIEPSVIGFKEDSLEIRNFLEKLKMILQLSADNDTPATMFSGVAGLRPGMSDNWDGMTEAAHRAEELKLHATRALYTCFLRSSLDTRHKLVLYLVQTLIRSSKTIQEEAFRMLQEVVIGKSCVFLFCIVASFQIKENNWVSSEMLRLIFSSMTKLYENIRGRHEDVGRTLLYCSRLYPSNVNQQGLLLATTLKTFSYKLTNFRSALAKDQSDYACYSYVLHMFGEMTEVDTTVVHNYLEAFVEMETLYTSLWLLKNPRSVKLRAVLYDQPSYLMSLISSKKKSKISYEDRTAVMLRLVLLLSKRDGRWLQNNTHIFNWAYSFYTSPNFSSRYSEVSGSLAWKTIISCHHHYHHLVVVLANTPLVLLLENSEASAENSVTILPFIQTVIVPGMAEAMERGRVSQFIGPLPESPESAVQNNLVVTFVEKFLMSNIKDIHLRILISQMGCLFIKHASEHIATKKSNVYLLNFLQFGWPCLQEEHKHMDPVVRYHGLMLISYAICQFSINRQVIMQSSIEFRTIAVDLIETILKWEVSGSCPFSLQSKFAAHGSDRPIELSLMRPVVVNLLKVACKSHEQLLTTPPPPNPAVDMDYITKHCIQLVKRMFNGETLGSKIDPFLNLWIEDILLHTVIFSLFVCIFKTNNYNQLRPFAGDSSKFDNYIRPFGTSVYHYICHGEQRRDLMLRSLFAKFYSNFSRTKELCPFWKISNEPCLFVSVVPTLSRNTGGIGTVYTAVTLLKAMSYGNPHYVEQFASPLIRTLHRLTRDHITSNDKTRTTSDLMLWCLDVLKPIMENISHDLQRALLHNVLLVLIEKTNSLRLFGTIVLLVVEWMKMAKPTGPSLRERQIVLIKLMQCIDKKLPADTEVRKLFHNLVHSVYSHVLPFRKHSVQTELQLNEFEVDDSANALIPHLLYFCHMHPDVASRIFINCIQSLWNSLTVDLKEHVSSWINPFLACVTHTTLRGNAKNVIRTFLEGFISCDPLPDFSPFVLSVCRISVYLSETDVICCCGYFLSFQYLGKAHNVWHLSMIGLEKMTFGSEMPLDDRLAFATYREALHALADLHQQLNDFDMYCAALNRRPGINFCKEGLAKEQYGLFSDARRIYSNIETNCPKEWIWKASLYHGYMAFFFNDEESATTTAIVERLVPSCQRLLIKEWRRLPKAITEAHIALMQSGQQLGPYDQVGSEHAIVLSSLDTARCARKQLLFSTSLTILLRANAHALLPLEDAYQVVHDTIKTMIRWSECEKDVTEKISMLVCTDRRIQRTFMDVFNKKQMSKVIALHGKTCSLMQNMSGDMLRIAIQCHLRVCCLGNEYKARLHFGRLFYLLKFDKTDLMMGKIFECLFTLPPQNLAFWIPQLFDILCSTLYGTWQQVIMHAARMYPQCVYYHMVSLMPVYSVTIDESSAMDNKSALLYKLYVNLKLKHPNMVYFMDNFIKELTNEVCQESPGEQLLRMVIQLERCYQVVAFVNCYEPTDQQRAHIFQKLSEIASFLRESKLKSPDVLSVCEAAFDELRQVQLVFAEIPTILRKVFNLRKSAEQFLKQSSSLMCKEKFCKSLLTLRPHTLDVLLPHLALNPTETIRPVYIHKFLPIVEFAQIGYLIGRRFHIVGTDGLLFRGVNQMLAKERLTASRHLQINVPVLIPIGPDHTCILDDPNSKPIIQFFKQHLKMTGKVTEEEELIFTYYQELVSQQSAHAQVHAMLQRIFKKVQATVRTADMIDQLRRCLPDSADFVTFRNQMAAQLGLQNMLYYVMHLAPLYPEELFVSMKSGQPVTFFLRYEIDSDNYFDGNMPVGFRLTPAMAEFFGMAIPGCMVPCAVASARVLLRRGFLHWIRPFVWDEIQSLVVGKSREEMIHHVHRCLSAVENRLKTLADEEKGEAKIITLFNAAYCEDNLNRTDPSANKLTKMNFTNLQFYMLTYAITRKRSVILDNGYRQFVYDLGQIVVVIY
ncbi:hypothetical protein Tsp_10464, partial [Trichinella spiralis]|uniref:hypothetical protein n=1 Tax=Trichinella spiralis TaxID=6334 RepID=UPI0001EFEE79